MACARVVLDGREFRSGNFRDGGWTQQADIFVHGRTAGLVEVEYVEPRLPRDEGPFRSDERRLINAIASRLGRVAEGLAAERLLRDKERELRERMTHLSRVGTMGEMASNIAHEVNQPLTAIAAYAQAARRLLDAGVGDQAEDRGHPHAHFAGGAAGGRHHQPPAGFWSAGGTASASRATSTRSSATSSTWPRSTAACTTCGCGSRWPPRCPSSWPTACSCSRWCSTSSATPWTRWSQAKANTKDAGSGMIGVGMNAIAPIFREVVAMSLMRRSWD